MIEKFYTPRNIASVAVHYGLTAALVVGSVSIGAPWAIGAGIVLAGGLMPLLVKKQKDFLEQNLQRHPDVHQFSPRLGKTVEELYKKSGLKSETFPVYDFKPEKKTAGQKDGFFKDLLRELFEQMAKTHNAAALRLGKPVIMISEPALKLLDDAEEKAVLAHEFAHAASYHQHTSLPRGFASSFASMALGLTTLGAAISTGITGVLSAAGASIVANVGYSVLNPRRRSLMDKKDDSLSLVDLKEKKKIKSRAKLAGELASAAVYTLFSPVYLGLFAASKITGTASKILAATFSRSNEYQADRGAVVLGGDPLALITGLRKLSEVQKLSIQFKLNDGKPLPEPGALQKAWKNMTATHPTLERRIKRLSDIARKNGVSEKDIAQAATGKIDIPAGNDIPVETLRTLMRAL